MTDINPNGALPPAQRALHEIAHGSENVVALSTLAVSEVLLPAPGSEEYPDGGGGVELPREIQLPVYEQEDGRQLVPVFTSENRMAEALPATRRYRLVQLAAPPRGASRQWPFSSVPSSAAKTASESNRGKHSQSSDPSRPISPAESRSEMSA